MKTYILCTLMGVAFVLSSCNEAPSVPAVVEPAKEAAKEVAKASEPKEVAKASEPKEVAKAEPKAAGGDDMVAGKFSGKLFAVNAAGDVSDASVKAGVEHYVLYHSASW